MTLNQNPISPDVRSSSTMARTKGADGSAFAPYGVSWQAIPVVAYLHAIRRRWAAALVLGGLLAAAAMAAVFFSTSEEYTAIAYVRVAVNSPAAWKLPNEARVANEYEFFRGTQQQLIKSRFVLHAALGAPGIRELPTIRKEGEDAFDWLEKSLRVGVVKDSELLTVSLSAPQMTDAIKILKAVVDAYKAEVETLDSENRRTRLAELEENIVAREEQLRQKRTYMKGFVDKWGTSDAQALSLTQQILVQHFGENRRELAVVQAEKRRVQAELKAQQAILDAYKNGKPEDLMQSDYIAALGNDPIYRQALSDLSMIQRDNAVTESVAMGPLVKKYNNTNEGLQSSMQTQLDLRRKEILTQVLQASKAKASMEATRLQNNFESIQAEETRLKEEVARLREQTEKIGAGSIEVEMVRGEIRQLETVFASIVDQREKLKVELKSESRITVIPTDATEPLKSNLLTRVALIGLAGFAGFFLPVVGLVLWDLQGKRVNSAKQTSDETGLDLVGTLPLLPNQAIRRLNSTSDAGARWRSLITESIDGISARVLYEAGRTGAKVLMVASAEGREGKTTLAVQLAMSLARLGHRTLLVDADLRCPTIHRLFAFDVSPGVGEVLRGESEVQDTVRPTSYDNLFAVAAGAWNRAGLALLAGEGLGRMFQRLRTEFAFVIVDGGTVLPVPDARFVCRHVDAVVLAAVRDVTRIPQLRSAGEILASFGVRLMGTVVADVASTSTAREFQTQDAASA